MRGGPRAARVDASTSKNLLQLKQFVCVAVAVAVAVAVLVVAVVIFVASAVD